MYIINSKEEYEAFLAMSEAFVKFLKKIAKRTMEFYADAFRCQYHNKLV